MGYPRPNDGNFLEAGIGKPRKDARQDVVTHNPKVRCPCGRITANRNEVVRYLGNCVCGDIVTDDFAPVFEHRISREERRPPAIRDRVSNEVANLFRIAATLECE
jgi:hypothetical protein